MIPEIANPVARRKQEFETPFERGVHERPLRLLVDWATVPVGLVSQVLEELRRHPQIEVYGTRSTDDRRVDFESGPTSDAAVIRNATGDVVSRVGLRRTNEEFVRAACQIDGACSERRVLEGHLAAFAANRLDALVTESPALLARDYRLFVTGSTNVLTSREAIALAGLFLRARGEYSLTPRIPNVIDWKSGEDFYGALVDVLVPSSVLWANAVRPPTVRGYYEETQITRVAVANSIDRQVARALRARDHLQVARRGALSSDTPHEVAAQFEYALISLSGAFDTLAELCAAVYGIGKTRSESWHHKGWTKKLRKGFAASVADVAASEDVQRTLTVLHELRNTVHGPTLTPRMNGQDPLWFGRGRGARNPVVLVPPTRLQSFCDALAAWEGIEPKWWGVTYERRGNAKFEEYAGGLAVSHTSRPTDPVAEINVDPGICLERIFVFAVAALERIAASIDWGKLHGPDFPGRPTYTPEEEFVRERLWLLGGVW